MKGKNIIISIFSIIGACFIEYLTNHFLDSVELNIQDSNNFIKFIFQSKFSFFELFICCLFVFLIFLIITKLRKSKKSPLEKKQEKFLKQNNREAILKEDIYIRYDLYFSDVTGQPTPYNLIVNCKKKDVNTILENNKRCIISNSCEDSDCPFRGFPNISVLKDALQSNLISEWIDFNKK